MALKRYTNFSMSRGQQYTPQYDLLIVYIFFRSYFLIRSQLVFIMHILCHMSVNLDTMLRYLCLDIVERLKEEKLNATEKLVDGKLQTGISCFVKVVCYLISFHQLRFYSRVPIKCLCSLCVFHFLNIIQHPQSLFTPVFVSFNVLEHIKYKISHKTNFFWLQRLTIQ